VWLFINAVTVFLLGLFFICFLEQKRNKKESIFWVKKKKKLTAKKTAQKGEIHRGYYDPPYGCFVLCAQK